MTGAGIIEWTVFWTVVAVALVADVVVARLGGRTPAVRNAALWSGVWIGLGVLFGVWVALRLGRDAGITYLTAYVLEKSLSVDNLFLFVLIFEQTGVPPALQHRALFWGIVSALILRAVLIGLGVYLLERFHWVIYARSASRPATAGSTCACASRAVKCRVATARRIVTRRGTSRPRAIRSCGRSRRAKTGSGAMPIA